MRIVKVVYNRLLDVGCFSHALDLVGDRMKTPNLDNFAKSWIGLFARSPKTRLAWRTKTGLPPPSYSATRWWSRFEVMNQVLNAFGDILPFLNSDDLPPATSNKLLEILNDPPTQRRLKIELKSI